MLTCATKEVMDHIAERHGPGGEGDAQFDANFLKEMDGYGPIMKKVFEGNIFSEEEDNSGRTVYRYYHNFNKKTGIGQDKDGKSVVFKGVEMLGTPGDKVFWVETMFPKGILKT